MKIHRPFLLSAAVTSTFLCGQACAPRSETTAGAPAPRSDIDRIRSETQALIEEQNKQRYNEWAQGIAANLPETYRNHEKLVSAETSYRLLTTINQTNDSRFGKAIRYLRAWVIEQVIGRDLLPILDQIEAAEEAPVTYGDQTFPFEQLTRRLAKEPDSEKRKAIFQAALPVADQLAQLHVEHGRKAREAAKLIGFVSDIELVNELRATDVAAAGPVAQQLLNETDALYISTLKSLGKSLVGIEADKMRPSDNPRLMRQVSYDVAIPAETLLPTVEKTFAALGFELKPPFVNIDGLATSGKNPLTAAFPVSVPKDVRISFSPIGGVGPLESLLHESALALQWASNKSPWFEFQQLGNPTVRESFAFLFRRLAGNPIWVEANLTRLNEAQRKDYVRWQAFRQLLTARRHASRVLFNLAVASQQTTDPAALYQNLMSRAYGYRVDETDRRYWAADHDLDFESLDYFRAWMLEASIESSLELRFGDHWFDKKDAGTWLRDTWALGSELTTEDMLARVDLKALDVNAFVARIKKRLL